MGSNIYARVLLVSACVLLAVPVVFGHHSFSAIYDGSKVTELQAVVTEAEWINPHIYIHVDVKDESGEVTTWSLEGGPTRRMRDAGITKRFVDEAVGQAVTVYGYPAKNGNTFLFLKKMVFPDGSFFAYYHDALDNTGIGDVTPEELGSK